MKVLAYLVGGFVTLSVGATTLVWWDTAPQKTPMAKYRLGQQVEAGLIVYEPITPGPELWNFECAGSEKDCGDAATRRGGFEGTVPGPRVEIPIECGPCRDGSDPPCGGSVPEPGTLALLGLGLLLLRRKLQ